MTEEQLAYLSDIDAVAFGNNKTGNLLDLCKALFAYSDTALTYFS